MEEQKNERKRSNAIAITTSTANRLAASIRMKRQSIEVHYTQLNIDLAKLREEIKVIEEEEKPLPQEKAIELNRKYFELCKVTIKVHELSRGREISEIASKMVYTYFKMEIESREVISNMAEEMDMLKGELALAKEENLKKKRESETSEPITCDEPIIPIVTVEEVGEDAVILDSSPIEPFQRSGSPIPSTSTANPNPIHESDLPQQPENQSVRVAHISEELNHDNGEENTEGPVEKKEDIALKLAAFTRRFLPRHHGKDDNSPLGCLCGRSFTSPDLLRMHLDYFTKWGKNWSYGPIKSSVPSKGQEQRKAEMTSDTSTSSTTTSTDTSIDLLESSTVSSDNWNQLLTETRKSSVKEKLVKETYPSSSSTSSTDFTLAASPKVHGVDTTAELRCLCGMKFKSNRIFKRHTRDMEIRNTISTKVLKDSNKRKRVPQQQPRQSHKKKLQPDEERLFYWPKLQH